MTHGPLYIRGALLCLLAACAPGAAGIAVAGDGAAPLRLAQAPGVAPMHPVYRYTVYSRRAPRRPNAPRPGRRSDKPR